MPALDIAASILFSENSKLYKKLVLEEQKARYIGGGAFDSRDPYLFSIAASVVDKGDLQYIKDEVIRTINDFINNDIDEKLLADTKSNLKYSFAMRMDSPDAIAGNLSHYIAKTGDPEAVNRVYELYKTINADQVKAIAKKYFVPTGLTIATISEDPEGGVK
jgi:zinc protease